MPQTTKSKPRTPLPFLTRKDPIVSFAPLMWFCLLVGVALTAAGFYFLATVAYVWVTH